ncbi:hypothetical protein [Paenisporosarcina sp. TG20]|uniref:hypothetical protein n=1 Tax=Paenisporosarcina sp. TG20 TaxID=1211706 RepID=UPI000379D82C|nr:hypothetical protein [Paenisporosarcina sp. TG20]
MELKRVAYGIITAGTIVFFRYIDLHIYDMPALVSLILIIVMMFISYKLVEKSTFLKQKVSRMTYYFMNIGIVFLLFFAFYLLEI